ncbi:MAG: FecCD family ABC transporter permease [Clostridium sp.]
MKGKTFESKRFCLLLSLLVIALIFTIILSVTIGSVKIDAIEVWKVIYGKLFNENSLNNIEGSVIQIVWQVRLPRVLLGVLIGAGLAVVGVAMQALVQNPLADPYILGVSSGASLGATLFALTGLGASFWGLGIQSFAFVGSVAASMIVYYVAKLGGRQTPLKFVLAGTAIGSICSSITSFITMTSSDREGIRTVMFWLMGSLNGVKWDDLTLPALAILIGIIILIYQYRNLNLLIMGEETAITLGVDLELIRKMLMILTSLITAVMVCTAGTIGFVGIMIPHIVRITVGANHKKVLPISALVGAIFLVWADVLARSIYGGQEIPIGVITSIIGAPWFLWLMIRGSGTFGGAKK